MRKIWRITGWIVLILIAGAVAAWFGFLRPEPPPISEYDRSRITVMPLPAKLKLHQEDIDLSNLQGYEFHGVNTPRMERAVKRFYNNISAFTGLESEPGEKNNLY
jgi:hexosaminidase